MEILHYNDEEKELHRYLVEHGHVNTILPASADPFQVIRARSFDAAFVGFHPHGINLIRALRRRNPDCIVTIITSDRDARRAVEAMKTGAFDYLLSPLDFTDVERTCILMTRDFAMLEERRKLQDQLALTAEGARLIGTSQAVEDLRRLVAKAAVCRAPVLLLGETGTGKELVARLLHELSPRRDQPLVSINCAAIPTTLLESELFGYKKGAFTGAEHDRTGLLAQADGGTFFFDEIEDLDLMLQGKLLRVLQQGEIMPLGARAIERLDVRFVSAANQDLLALVRSKRFREDLFYRLNVVPIPLPPLRERMEDVVALTRHFLAVAARREGREPLKVSPVVWQWLHNHSWPGNIRELENLCQRAVALTDGDTFDTDVLALTSKLPSRADASARLSVELVDRQSTDYRAARDVADRQLLERMLVREDGNVSRAAHAMGISRTTFYAKARKLDLTLPRQRMG